jgi:hypothetical protein
MTEHPLMRYVIELLDEAGAVVWEHVIDCKDDNEAINRSGRLPHPHPMRLIFQGKVVASFPPTGGQPGSRTVGGPPRSSSCAEIRGQK